MRSNHASNICFECYSNQSANKSLMLRCVFNPVHDWKITNEKCLLLTGVTSFNSKWKLTNCYPQVFNQVIERSEKCDILETRLEILHREITLSVYQNVSRGLFERHKLVFSFLLNMAIFLNAELVTPDQWNFILRGPAGTKVVNTLFIKFYTT